MSINNENKHLKEVIVNKLRKALNNKKRFKAALKTSQGVRLHTEFHSSGLFCTNRPFPSSP